MNVTDTVKAMLLGYPTLFKDRMDCLIFLFTVSGNGHDWDENGELTDKYRQDKIAPFQDEEKEVEDFWNSSEPMKALREEFPEMEDSVRLRVRQHNNQLQFLHDNLDLIASYNDTFNYATYQQLPRLTEYCSLFEIPKNITDDWANAVETVINHILYKESGHFRTTNFENNLQMAKKAKQLLGKICRAKKEKEG
jgi:hypothetical protein